MILWNEIHKQEDARSFHQLEVNRSLSERFANFVNQYFGKSWEKMSEDQEARSWTGSLHFAEVLLWTTKEL